MAYYDININVSPFPYIHPNSIQRSLSECNIYKRFNMVGGLNEIR